jgi:hypothetical protein
LVIENRFVIKYADDVLNRLLVGKLVMKPDNNAGEFASGKRHCYTHSDRDPRLQRLRQFVGKCLIERNG